MSNAVNALKVFPYGTPFWEKSGFEPEDITRPEAFVCPSEGYVKYEFGTPNGIKANNSAMALARYAEVECWPSRGGEVTVFALFRGDDVAKQMLAVNHPLGIDPSL
jgi:hypothetical protein